MNNWYNKPLLDKWLKELRSGKRKQCASQLKKRLEDGTYGYCCLGVLNSINQYKCKVLCDPVVDSSGKQRSTPVNIHHDWWLENGFSKFVDTDTLASMNDEGKTFEEIADFIEQKEKEFLDTQFSN